jgi:predicted RNA-binding Zn-ribbon protein involved in translation (DUF1610 family)
MAFNVVDVETGTLIRFQRKAGLAEFKTPSRAIAYAKKRGEKDGRKYKIKAIVADDGAWIKREQDRMANGYVRTPFDNTVWYNAALGRYTERQLHGAYEHLIPLIGIAKNHFAHVSLGNKSMLAYTESAEKGARDIQTQIKPGAYLAKYFSSVLTPDDISALVNEWQRLYADVTLKFARTPSDIVHIYRNGPRSCMSGSAQEYATRDQKGEYHHPCEVYGQPHSDLTLAYIDGKGGVSARCLVWEERKQYGRIYGSATLLERELINLGYKIDSFEGARLAKIPAQRGYYVMAYVDGCTEVFDAGDHFVIANDRVSNRRKKGELWVPANFTNGCVPTKEAVVYTCTACDEDIEPGEERIYQGSHYCQDCYDEHFFRCDYYGGDYRRSEGMETVYCRSGNRWVTRIWSRHAVERGAFFCPVEKAYFRLAYRYVRDDGTVISTMARDKELVAQATAAPPPPAPPAPQPVQERLVMTRSCNEWMPFPTRSTS